jgi:hypothetical protein
MQDFIIKETPKEIPITGLRIGETEVTLNELWTKTTKSTGRI